MTGLLLGIAGLAIIVFVAVDVLWTTLLLEGGGPLTTRLSAGLWEVALMLHHRRPNHRALSLAGFGIVLLAITVWVVLMWTGWLLVFLPENAVLDTSTDQPANFWDRVYFVGFTLITLGVGDFRPGAPLWQVATPIASATGFFLLTLAITYLLPLVAAVVQKRQLAAHVTSLGRTPAEILTRSWTGTGFGHLSDHLVALTVPLMQLAQSHLAYPALHYFHSRERKTALAPSVAVLDEALSLLEQVVVPDRRPDPAVLYPLRDSIKMLLETLSSAFLEPESEAPPDPQLAGLRAAGIPIVGDGAFRRSYSEDCQRRRLLLALVRREGWAWSDVTATDTRTPEPGEGRVHRFPGGSSR